MNEQNHLRRKMVQALQTHQRMLAEGKLLQAHNALVEYRLCRQQLLKLWGDNSRSLILEAM
ncbi:Fur-regulated basic protein B [Paenibacillus lactis]